MKESSGQTRIYGHSKTEILTNMHNMTIGRSWLNSSKLFLKYWLSCCDKPGNKIQRLLQNTQRTAGSSEFPGRSISLFNIPLVFLLSLVKCGLPAARPYSRL